MGLRGRVNHIISLLLFLTFVVATESKAWAVSTLHIGFGAGTDCAEGCGGDPNVSGSPTASAIFDIYQNSGGAGTALQPVLLIIGVPNETAPSFFSNASIINLTSINPYPGGTEVGSPPNSWTYGAAEFGLTGYNGNFTSGEVYNDVLGLPNANNSNNFGNWHDTDLEITGIDASGFGIYAFGLYADLGAKGLLNITFADETTVPVGSYVIGYAKIVDSNGNTTYYSTPFTESGLQTVPEPSALFLMGSGLLALGALRRKLKG